MFARMLVFLCVACSVFGQSGVVVRNNELKLSDGGKMLLADMNKNLLGFDDFKIKKIWGESSFSGALFPAVGIEARQHEFLEICDVLDNNFINQDYPFLGIMVYVKNEDKTTKLAMFRGEDSEKMEIKRTEDERYSCLIYRSGFVLSLRIEVVCVKSNYWLKVSLPDGCPIGVFFYDSFCSLIYKKNQKVDAEIIESRIRGILRARWYMRKYSAVSAFVGEFNDVMK